MTLKNIFAAKFLCLLFFSICFSQTGNEVDPQFAPVIYTSFLSGLYTGAIQQKVQPDGKVLVSGKFNVVDSVQRNNVARLNADGTLDSSFNCTACNFDVVNSVTQPDGKIIISGFDGSIYFEEKLIRVNSDGSIDQTFTNSFPVEYESGTALFVQDIQSDGKIYMVRRFIQSGGDWEILYRLNPNGTLDSSFTTTTVNFSDRLHIKVFPDGRVFMYGRTPFGQLALLNDDGTKNQTFDSPVLTNTATPGQPFIADIASQPDGKILIYGAFTTVNGVQKRQVARLNTDESVDANFTLNAQFETGNAPGFGRIFVLSDNKILVASSNFTNEFGKIGRLNADGSKDNTFIPPASITPNTVIDIDLGGRTYGSGRYSGLNTDKVFRLNADGTLDSSYNPDINDKGTISKTAVQTDGKIIIIGGFSGVNGILRYQIARLNADGTVDTTFSAVLSLGSRAGDIAVQADGKILLSGTLSVNNETVQRKLLRLNSDGSLDSSFNNIQLNELGFISDIETLADGKIFIAGSFETINGASKTYIAKLNSDGSVDNTFNTVFGIGTGTRVSDILVQSNGQIMAGGRLASVNGSFRSNIVRLNANGTTDESFFTSQDDTLIEIARQTDGKYLILGSDNIKRVNADGSFDTSFRVVDLFESGNFTDMLLLQDGTILIGGSFRTVENEEHKSILRLNTNGQIDSYFLRDGVNGEVSSITALPDNKILIGGYFYSIGNVFRTSLAKVSVSPFAKYTKFDFNGDGRADISVFRPSNNVWYQLLSPNYQFSSNTFGTNEDIPVPADYDGDGKTDLAIFRPSTGVWWYAASTANGAFRTVQWGQAGDIPLPSDTNEDNKADFVVFRPSNSTWYRLDSYGFVTTLQFGQSGDKPLIGDFDFDGRDDPAIYRPSTGTWWFAGGYSNDEVRTVQWGISGDIPVPADYNGDNRTDVAVYRPSNGGWYILNSIFRTTTILQFGLAEDKPVPADYDGDGKTDIAVFRPSTGAWYLLRSTAGFTGVEWGSPDDIPVPNAFIR